MSTFFLSNLEEKINNIKYHLIQIKNVYDEIITNSETKMCVTHKYMNEIINARKDYESKIKKIDDFLENTKNQIVYKTCNHNFVDDSIDIDCERSQNIRYCSICFYTV